MSVDEENFIIGSRCLPCLRDKDETEASPTSPWQCGRFSAAALTCNSIVSYRILIPTLLVSAGERTSRKTITSLLTFWTSRTIIVPIPIPPVRWTGRSMDLFQCATHSLRASHSLRGLESSGTGKASEQQTLSKLNSSCLPYHATMPPEEVGEAGSKDRSPLRCNDHTTMTWNHSHCRSLTRTRINAQFRFGSKTYNAYPNQPQALLTALRIHAVTQSHLLILLYLYGGILPTL